MYKCIIGALLQIRNLFTLADLKFTILHRRKGIACKTEPISSVCVVGPADTAVCTGSV